MQAATKRASVFVWHRPSIAVSLSESDIYVLTLVMKERLYAKMITSSINRERTPRRLRGVRRIVVTCAIPVRRQGSLRHMRKLLDQSRREAIKETGGIQAVASGPADGPANGGCSSVMSHGGEKVALKSSIRLQPAGCSVEIGRS